MHSWVREWFMDGISAFSSRTLFCPWTQMWNSTVHLTHSFLSLVGLRHQRSGLICGCLGQRVVLHLKSCSCPSASLSQCTSRLFWTGTCLHVPGVVYFKVSLSNNLVSLLSSTVTHVRYFLWRSCQFSRGNHYKKQINIDLLFDIALVESVESALHSLIVHHSLPDRPKPYRITTCLPKPWSYVLSCCIVNADKKAQVDEVLNIIKGVTILWNWCILSELCRRHR